MKFSGVEVVGDADDDDNKNSLFLFFPISKKNTNVSTGARPLKRAITALVDDPLSDALLSGALEEGDVARLDDVSGEPDSAAWSKVPGAVVGAAGVVCTSVKPGQAKRRGGGPGGSGNTTLKSEVVYSTLSARRAAKEAARAKEQEKEDVKA